MDEEYQKQRRTILISGAGIAGLASALFVARAGFRVDLFEQAEKLNEIGAGIQLSPNAMHVLAQLGLDHQIKSVANSPPAIDVYQARNGKLIVQIPLGVDLINKYQQPYVVIQRADLIRILESACKNDPDIKFHMGVTVRDCVSHPNGVSIIADSVEGTDTHRGLALLGADGVSSVIRMENFDKPEERPTGASALRTMIRKEKLPQQIQDQNIKMWLGPQGHLVIYPISDHYTNIVLTLPDKFLGKPDQSKFFGDEISVALKKWHPLLLKVFSSTQEWTIWPIYQAPLLKNWHDDTVILIGDAAHAMSPHAAQGAAMALEDAAVLGDLLSQDKTLPEIFAQYQFIRKKRVNAVRRLSTSNQQIYQLPELPAKVRNVAMRILGGQRLQARQRWIYDWRPPT